ncbi:MAG: hypothetical protein LC797_22805 [Chloroflexi bacterium]|nr:hypothetical protein [Chloroflexota bacterium]
MTHARRAKLLFQTILVGAHLEGQLDAMVACARELRPQAIVWGDGNYVAAVPGDLLDVPHACVQVFVTGTFPSGTPAVRHALAARLEVLRAALRSQRTRT